MKLVKIGFIALISVAILSPFAWAGNRKMIEKRIKELDTINKQAVRQIPNLPKSGKVKLKASVIPELSGVRFKIHQTDIKENYALRSSPTLLLSSSQNEKHLTFTDALSSYSKKPAEIIGYRDDSDGEEYTPMKVGILRLIKKIK